MSIVGKLCKCGSFVPNNYTKHTCYKSPDLTITKNVNGQQIFNEPVLKNLIEKEKENNFEDALITLVEARRPLWDHKLLVIDRSKCKKSKLWIEIYTELNGNVIQENLNTLINELKNNKPKSPSPPEQPTDDIKFAEYLVSIMADLPKYKKRKLQSQFISQVFQETDINL